MAQSSSNPLTRLVCISDTHSTRGFSLPAGDILIHAGDFTRIGTYREIEEFLKVLQAATQYRLKIFIAGNHDITIDEEFYKKNWRRFHRAQEDSEAVRKMVRDPKLKTDYGIIYLEDESFFDPQSKLTFYGSPHQPEFCSWAFNVARDSKEIRDIWSKIPLNTDILITHGPPYGILDSTNSGEHVGCAPLLERVRQVRPKLHVFGHIHEGYGKQQNQGDSTIFVNASTCDLRYKPVQPPIVVDL